MIKLWFAILICGCVKQAKPVDCKQLLSTERVNVLGIDDLYKEALWQSYKFNLVEGDQFRIRGPRSSDSILEETSLAEFDLKFHNVRQIGDTTIFTLFFEKGVSPKDHEYYCTVTFWEDSDHMEIGDRIIFVFPRNMYESEFSQYLLEHKEKLSPMLKCLSIERNR